MNVNRRGSGTRVVRVRVLAAGLVLLAAGCMALGWSSRSRQAGQIEALIRGVAANSPVNSALNAQPSNPLASLAQSLPVDLKVRALAAFAQLPLMFEPNVGQAGSGAKFLARGPGYGLFLNADGAVISLHASDSSRPAARHGTGSEELSMKLVGSNLNARVEGGKPLPGKSNYFLGNNSAGWHRDIPQFARVRYENVYPGINLVFYGNQGRLEYDFLVSPGANPAQAELQFDGSKKIELKNGDLILRGETTSVRLEAPQIYQQIGERRQPVEGRFVMRAANRVGFEVGPYDHSRDLVIDPVLNFSTYFGGNGSVTYPSVAVDSVGSIYLVGSVQNATGFPLGSVVATQQGPGANIVVAKINPSQPPSVSYVTFLGGTGTDTSIGIAVNGAGNAYIVGNTSSTDFPTTLTAYQLTPKAGSTGTQHVFVSQLDPTGSQLPYSSYLSGSGTDTASGMTADNQGNVYITGTTTSTSSILDLGTATNQFPVSAPPQTQPFQTLAPATIQFFVTKVDTVASSIGSVLYSTYFGGGTPTNATAQGGGIVVDTSGNVYFTGTTNFTYTGTSRITDFPILNAYQPCLDQAPPTIITLPVSCTYSFSGAPPTDAFVAKLNPSAPAGTQLIWSTYVGGSQTDSATGIALDAGAANAANVYITGTTNSPDVTLVSNIASYQQCLDEPVNPASGTACTTVAAPAPTDAFVARLSNPTESSTTAENVSLSYFSYLGGSGNDAGLALTVDTANGALMTGWTQSTDFPYFPNAISNPTLCTPPNQCVLQSHLAGAQNAFFAHLLTTTVTGNGNVGAYVTYFGGNGTDRGTSIVQDNNQNTYFAGDTTSSANFPLQDALQSTLTGTQDAFVTKLGTAAELVITDGVVSGAKTTNPSVSAGSPVTTIYTVNNNGPDLATGIIVTGNIPTGTTFISASASSGSCTSSVTAGTNGTSAACTVSSLQAGSSVTITFVLTPNEPGGFQPSATASSNNNTNLSNTFSVPFTATDFSVTVNPRSNSVAAAGDTAPYVVNLTPLGSFGTPISLSCSQGVPTGAACNFSPTSASLASGSPASPTLNITTTARPINVASLRFGRSAYAMWLAVPGMALLGIGLGTGARRRRFLGVFLLCALLGMIMLLPACSKSSTTQTVAGTPAGTYGITVTATSGSLTHNATISLVVP